MVRSHSAKSALYTSSGGAVRTVFWVLVVVVRFIEDSSRWKYSAEIAIFSIFRSLAPFRVRSVGGMDAEKRALNVGLLRPIGVCANPVPHKRASF